MTLMTLCPSDGIQRLRATHGVMRSLAFGLVAVGVGALGCSSDDAAARPQAGADAGADSQVQSDAADSDAGLDAQTPQDAATDSGPTGCQDVDCGNFGKCVEAAGTASCQCDPGYHAEGLSCVLDPCTGAACPRSVADWQKLYDAEWSAKDEADCLSRAKSGGFKQEHYFLAYCIDGLTSIWRATGDNQYLDTTLEYIQYTLDDAKLASDGFRRWPGDIDPKGVPLWESYYWRMVTTLIRVMQKHPTLLNTGTYQAQYDALLKFSEHDIWDKWESDGLGNLYRSRTHMASHWARIGMELYRITGKAKYKTVFDNISGGSMVGYPSNLHDQFYPNPKTPTAYTWASVWGAPKGQDVQDTSHAGAIISFIELAAEAGMYWQQSDLDSLHSTLTDVVWPASQGQNYFRNVDGTGGLYGPKPGNTIDSIHGRLNEWLVLGRHDLKLQKRIEADYTGNHLKYFGTQSLGIAALNAKILIDGKPAY